MDKISDFMGSLNPNTFNCVYSTNGMTLLTEKEYAYRLEEIHKLKQERYNLQQERDKYKSIVEGLNKFLEEEKDRLARECSQIYEDSLGKTRLVNEDIFNEINKILDKIKELEGSDK